MNKYTVGERISLIQKSSSISEIQNDDILPKPFKDDGFYFISYSHKNYKAVFCKILELLENDIKLWYDRGLETGISWAVSVRNKIYSYACKGIIFFISKEFLASESIYKEINLAYAQRKSCIFINLCEDDTELVEFTEKHMPKDVLKNFLALLENCEEFPIDTDAKVIVEKVKALSKPSLYKYKVNENSMSHGRLVKTLTDPNQTELSIPAYRMLKGKRYPVEGISDYSLANCIKLKKVKIPDGWTFIGKYAFMNCLNLEEVEFGKPGDEPELHMSAFTNCPKLKKITLQIGGARIWPTGNKNNYFEEIVLNSSFPYNMTAIGGLLLTPNLKKIEVPEHIEISEEAFLDCESLQSFDISKRCKRIGEAAFVGCKSLKKIVLPESIEEVSLVAFANCVQLSECIIETKKLKMLSFFTFGNSGLKEIELPNNLEKLGLGVFYNCKNLMSVVMRAKNISLDVSTFYGCDNLKTVVLDSKSCEFTNMAKVLNDSGNYIDFDKLSIEIHTNKIVEDKPIKKNIDEMIPSATTFYLIKSSKIKLSDDFVEVEPDKKGYCKYIKRV